MRFSCCICFETVLDHVSCLYWPSRNEAISGMVAGDTECAHRGCFGQLTKCLPPVVYDTRENVNLPRPPRGYWGHEDWTNTQEYHRLLDGDAATNLLMHAVITH